MRPMLAELGLSRVAGEGACLAEGPHVYIEWAPLPVWLYTLCSSVSL